MRWLPYVVVAACVAATVARVAAAWSRLPPIMASHFDGAGMPDGLMPRDSLFTSLALAFVAAALIPALCPLLLRHLPAGAINLPHGDYWLAPARRAESVARLQRWLAWFPVPVAALFALVIELTIDANIQRSALNTAVLWPGLALSIASFVVLVVLLYRQFPAPPSPRQRDGFC